MEGEDSEDGLEDEDGTSYTDDDDQENEDDEEEDEPATPPARTRPAIAHSESLLSELSEAGTAPPTAGGGGEGHARSPEFKMPLFIHGAKAGEVEDSAAWQSRARRMEAQGRDVNARAVPFSLTRDIRKLSAEVAEKVMRGNRLIFRIDGASSRSVQLKLGSPQQN